MVMHLVRDGNPQTILRAFTAGGWVHGHGDVEGEASSTSQECCEMWSRKTCPLQRA